jgi:hypothetical protein
MEVLGEPVEQFAPSFPSAPALFNHGRNSRRSAGKNPLAHGDVRSRRRFLEQDRRFDQRFERPVRERGMSPWLTARVDESGREDQAFGRYDLVESTLHPELLAIVELMAKMHDAAWARVELAKGDFGGARREPAHEVLGDRPHLEYERARRSEGARDHELVARRGIIAF